MSPYGSYVIETILTLVAVSALAFVLLYGARKAGMGRATGGLELVGRLPIDARRSVVLVKVAGQVLIVGVSEAGLTRLGELPASDVPAAPEASTTGFASVLASVKSGPLGGKRDV
jgi:flagellar protein FliO/FliZ